MKTITISGYIRERGNCLDGEDVLFIGDLGDQPLVELFQDNIAGRIVTIRYWISDVMKPGIEIKEAVILHATGLVEAEFNEKYSEMTGYLWTDEELKVGGHDLLQELRSYVDKFLYMEIDIHD
jgi:hypothetical protein